MRRPARARVFTVADQQCATPKHDDLQYYFKSLAPPEPENTTGDGEGKKGGKAKDPFAAPEEEKKQRF